MNTERGGIAKSVILSWRSRDAHGFVPITLWLGVQEYGEIWRNGRGGEGLYEDQESLATIGDSRMSALSDALTVHGFSAWWVWCFVRLGTECVRSVRCRSSITCNVSGI